MHGRTMMHGIAASLAAALLLIVPSAAQAAGGATHTASEWRNPKNTVHIRFVPCGGDRMCGKVIWASEKAKADARKGGVDDLVGANLFRNFRRVGPGEYKGQVFVPDMNRTFSGQVRIEGDRLTGRGCVLAGLVCKSQTWTRLS